jgi:uncharacterized protein
MAMMKPQPEPRQPAWWRQPMMWLVVGGPLSVVVAGLVTAVIAIRGADPVLTTPDPVQARSGAPAVQARNHVVTPPPASKP